MSNSTSQNQETKQTPLDSPLIKLAFLPQNHPKYFWKRLRTKGRLPAFKVEQLDREFPIRKAPISVNMSGGAIPVLSDVLSEFCSKLLETYGVGFSWWMAFREYQIRPESDEWRRRYRKNQMEP